MIRWLSEGDFPFANPASSHASGREAKRKINQVSEYLLGLFGLEGSHEVLFHSGASEGINTILRGFAQYHLSEKKSKAHVAHFLVDHSCVVEVVDELRRQGHATFSGKVNQQGDFSLDELLPALTASAPDKAQTLINWTWVNNETGVLWPLQEALALKERFPCLIHVDAVQAPGRMAHFQKLSPLLDAYTFSGHKFGALKGVGFTFIKKGFPFRPLILGGGQQKDRRSGTENAFGVWTLKLALEEMMGRFDYQGLERAKLFFEEKLRDLLGVKGMIIAKDAKHRNGNTVTFLLKGIKSDMVHAALDMNGIEVSTGSACSSSSSSPNRVLGHMGFDPTTAQGLIRLSFSPFLTMGEADHYFKVISPVLQKFL